MACQSGVWRPYTGALSVSGYNIPPNSSVDIGVHLFCAVGDPGYNSFNGGVGEYASAGINAFGSALTNYMAWAYQITSVVFCLDQI